MKRTAPCPLCGVKIRITRAGKVGHHRLEKDLYSGVRFCSGRGMSPKMTVLASFTSSSGADCEVREGKDGVIYCTCLAWRFSKPPKDCKHLLDIREALVKGDMSIFTRMQPANEITKSLGR